MGFVGVASRLCRFEPQYQGVIDSLLGRVAVAESLDDAVAIAKRFHYRFRIVTLDGQVVNAGGSLTGGSAARQTGLLSRQAEIRQLIIERSSKTYLVADATKFGKISFIKISDFSNINGVIVDKQLPAEWYTYFKQRKIALYECGADE